MKKGAHVVIVLIVLGVGGLVIRTGYGRTDKAEFLLKQINDYPDVEVNRTSTGWPDSSRKIGKVVSIDSDRGDQILKHYQNELLRLGWIEELNKLGGRYSRYVYKNYHQCSASIYGTTVEQKLVVNLYIGC